MVGSGSQRAIHYIHKAIVIIVPSTKQKGTKGKYKEKQRVLLQNFKHCRNRHFEFSLVSPQHSVTC